MARSISNVVRVAVWLFAASIAAGAPNSPQFVDLPSEMTVMNDALPRDPAPNITPLAFGWPDGQVCIVRGQGDRLLAAHSGNRGQTFDPDIDVLAGSGRTTVLTRAGFNTAREWLQADSDASGHLYVAAFSPNAAGGLDLIATTSSDAGAH